MKKFAAVLFVMFVWLFCAQTVEAQTSDLEKKVEKISAAVRAQHDALKEHGNLIKALLQCTDPTCVNKALKQQKVKKPPKKTGKKPPAPVKPHKATDLPDPPKSGDKAELEKYMQRLEAMLKDHEARIRVLESARIEMMATDSHLQAQISALLLQLAKKFPELKVEFNSVDILAEFRSQIADLHKELAAEKENCLARQKEIVVLLEEVRKQIITAKNKQSAIRFQLAPVGILHYNGDITRMFGLMSAELVIPMHRYFALATGGALGKGPRGFGTMYRAGGEVGGIVRFRFAGMGVWDFRHAGTITRWIGGTLGVGANIPFYSDSPERKRPPVEFVLFVDAGAGWLAEYGKDSLSWLAQAGVGVRF